jgi:L-lactate dehydrogenase complex protein LldF
MGAVLTSVYAGLENARDLPNAATMCNQCGVVCPVKIPLPDLLRKLREQQFERRIKPLGERLGLFAWRWLALRPALYSFATKIAACMLRRMGGESGYIRSLPAGGWTLRRDLPAPEGATFRELYQRRRQS